MTENQSIEKLIGIALIVSTEYLQEIQPLWNERLLYSSAIKRISQWVWSYFDQYNKAPNKDVEHLYFTHADKLSKEDAEDVEEILGFLSDEYEREQFNLSYSIDETKKYFKKQLLLIHAEKIKEAIEEGDITKAEELTISDYNSNINQSGLIDVVEPFEHPELMKEAFNKSIEPLIKFPKDLGRFWNDQLARDSFVAFMGPEKRGKSFWLIELAIRAIKSGCNVVFFQAGDMSRDQQLRRMATYLTKRPYKERYQNLYIPMVDCLYNQLDTCNKSERECDFGPFDGKDEKELKRPKYDDLVKACEEHKDYKPCRNCNRMKGAVWLKYYENLPLLDWKAAYREVVNFRKKNKKRFKLVTAPSETLTIAQIKSLLTIWEKREQFLVDVCVIDYADILAPDGDIKKNEFRHQTNKIWQRLRSLSTEKHCLVVTATQADAASYDVETLGKKHFSEDKRKYAHVTAMYGLNQTDEEKKIGIMRLNEIVVREDDFDITSSIKVLQRLQIGRPYLGGFR